MLALAAHTVLRHNFIAAGSGKTGGISLLYILPDEPRGWRCEEEHRFLQGQGQSARIWFSGFGD